MGIFNSITGPTLPVLAQHVCKSPTTVSWIFSGRSVGFLIGSGSGLCFDKALSVEIDLQDWMAERSKALD